MGAKEDGIVKGLLVAAAVSVIASPMIWVSDKLDHVTNSPVGFLSRDNRKYMMLNPRIKQINGPRGLFSEGEIEVVTKHRYLGNRERVIMRVRRHAEDNTYSIYQQIFNTPGDAILAKRKMRGYSAHIPNDLMYLLEGSGCDVNGGHVELRRIKCDSVAELLEAILKVTDLSLKLVERA